MSQIINIDNNILIGAHLSVAGGLENALGLAIQTNCTVVQIFTKSGRAWFAKPLTEEQITTFKKACKATPNVKTVIAHAGYLINIAAKNKDIEQQSIASLIAELKRADELGLDALVLHPGSHVGQGEETGLNKIAANLDIVFEQSKTKTMLLLETAAGQGTNLGYTFEQLAYLYKKVTHKKQLGFCLDTCHIFSAGYDISTTAGYKTVLEHFDTIVGLEHLKAIHLNDSKNECGAKLDRHENLGKGKIPLEAFACIMNDPRLLGVPKILETPIIKDSLEYKAEITLLKSMIIKKTLI